MEHNTQALELKPCPFCGCDDARVQVEYHFKWARVYCPLCGASTMSIQIEWNDPTEAVKLWNTRPIEDKLQSELAARIASTYSTENPRNRAVASAL